MKDLTKRQREILEFIVAQIRAKGYPPSVREIGAAIGLQSSSTVHSHLQKLENLGYIRRDPTKPRAIEILENSLLGNQVAEHSENGLLRPIAQIPVVGQVTAGAPILAVENIEEYFPLPKEFASHEEMFILRVRGDSMIEAGIFDGDYVIVEKTRDAKNGDIVVALIDEDEATVKRFFHEGDSIRLQPENSSMKPIFVKDLSILGRVTGLLRKF